MGIAFFQLEEMSPTPEDKAREVIDDMLHKAGWHIYDLKEANVFAYRKIKIPNVKCAERLGQGILRLAFSGELVSNPTRQRKLAPLLKGVAP